MSRGSQLLKRLGIDVRPGEALPAVLLFLGFFLIITFQYTAKTIRQSTFIDTLGAEYLPVVFLLVALCSYPPLRLYNQYADRVPRHKLLIASCLIVAGTMVVFYLTFPLGTKVVPVVYYVWVSIVFVLTVSQFWLYASNVLDPRQAKRLFGFVGSGGLLGGIAGGQVARLVAGRFDTYFALLVAAVMLGGVVIIMVMINRFSPPDESRVAGVVSSKPSKMDAAKGGFQTIRSSRHLTLIMWIMILTVMVAQVVDVQFNWAVDQAITDPDPDVRSEKLTAFYGNFFSVMGIAAFLFQLAFTARIHRTLGVGFAMRVLPVTMAVGTLGIFGSAAVVATYPLALLAMAILLKVGESGLRYSLEQATRELLFLPVPAQARLKAKAFIDVFVQRGAKGLAAILLLPVTFGLMQAVSAGWIALVLIAIWLFVIGLMSRQYVSSFRQGLKQRSVDAAVPINVSDVTTLELLVESLGSSDRRQVLHSLNLLAANKRGNLVPPLLLYHDDPAVRLRTLELLREIGRSDAAGLIERRLGDEDPEVRTEAIRALASLEGQNIVELMLPRLNELEPSIRGAAVACLVNHGSPEQVEKARDVLRELLSDAEPAARREAAKALGAVHEPEGREQLIRLLYDSDPAVIREAIAAIRRRVGRDGFSPMYVPTLISLLHNRRLKAEAREALVAFGEPVIPSLVHFMSDDDEPLWVRRALPKSIAAIGTEQAARTLIEALDRFEDRFLRRKVIEALSRVRDQPVVEQRRPDIEAAVRFEATKYLEALQRLSVLGLEEKGRLDGPEIDWSVGTVEPDLLERLLAERMSEHLTNIFGLLAVLYAPKDTWAAYRSLLSGQPALRNTALEYLDNTLSSSLRHEVALLLDNAPLAEKLQRARSVGLSGPPTKQRLLSHLLSLAGGGEAAENGLRVAAMYHIYSERIIELFPAVAAVRESASDTFVVETAAWVSKRVA